MENEERLEEQNNEFNNSLGNPVNSFRFSSKSSKKEKESIKNKIDETKARNLNRTSADVSNSANGSTLGNPSGLDSSNNENLSKKNRKNESSENRSVSSSKESKDTLESKNSGGKSDLNKDSKVEGKNDVKGSNLKNVGASLGNAALGAAASKSETVRKGVQTVNTVKGTVKFTKALIAFFSTPIGWGVLFILGLLALIILIAVIIAILVNSLGMKFGLSGTETTEFFNQAYEDGEYYEGMTREELDKLIEEGYNDNTVVCQLSLYQQIKAFFGFPDLSDPCELQHYIKKLLEDNESGYSIDTITPGHFMSSLYYSFDTQNYNEDGELFLKPKNYEKDGTIINDLDAITTLMEEKVYVKEDIKSLLDNYIVKESYYYVVWTYFPPEEEEEEGHWECVWHANNSNYISTTKFNLYLRYGKNVANQYVIDLNVNGALSSTSSECMDNLKSYYNYIDMSVRDMSKYSTKANPSVPEDDNAKISVSGDYFRFLNSNGGYGSISATGGTYGYDSGFIYTTYPKYDPDYTIDNIEYYDFRVDKDIETTIGYIESRQDYTNYLLGYPNTLNTKFYIGGNYSSGSSVCTYNIGGNEVNDIYVRLTYPPDENIIPGKYEAHTPISDELITFDKYILGVTYAENGGASDEAVKAQAIAAASYVLGMASKNGNNISLINENGKNIIEVSSSNFTQTYCDPDKGCVICSNPNSNHPNNALTLPADHPLANSSTCRVWKGALETNSSIRSAVNEVSGMVLVDNSGSIVVTGYISDVQNNWNALADSGSDYVEILRKSYGSEYMVSSPDCKYGATGDWASWRQYSEPWGSMYLGTKTVKSVGCFITSYAMAIAKSGPNVPSGFNPEMFVDIIKDNDGLNNNSFSYRINSLKAASGASSVIDSGVYIGGFSYEKKVQTIAEYLNNGYDVILRVKSDRSASLYNESNEHWVLVTGIRGTDILMADPASDKTVVLDKYHNEGIVQFQYVKFN